MKSLFRNYTDQPGITDDYHKVRAFFVKLGYAEFEYTRWDWMITHYCLDTSALGKIGLWEVDDEIVGIATYDGYLGTAYCLTLPAHSYLRQEMLAYARVSLANGDGDFAVCIRDADVPFQQIAAEAGFIATQEREYDSFFYLKETSTDYTLPDGFSVTAMKENFDLYQYRKVMWKGFNHELNGEGELVFTKDMEEETRKSMLRPHVDLDLKIAVTDGKGNFVAYCGMWYDREAGFAVVEPVATDPAFRRMGLGRAAVLEGLRRAGKRGATKALVGSQQPFYFRIGFRPHSTCTLWREKKDSLDLTG